MLANLLPGVREIRSPLAAGYLWLVAVWLVVEPGLSEPTTADGLVTSLRRLGEAVGSELGIGLAITFAAYVVGIVSVGAFSPVLRHLVTRGGRFEAKAIRLLERAAATHVDQLLSVGFAADVDRLIRERHEQLDEQPFEQARRLAEPSKSAPSVHAPRRGRRLRGARSPVRGASSLSEMTHDALDVQLDDQRLVRVMDLVADDLPRAKTTTLIGREQDLYAAVDRQEAEAEFRFAAAVPLVVLAAAAAAQLGGSLGGVVLLVGVAASVGLVWQARASDRLATQLMLEVMVAGRIVSPTIADALQEAASTMSRQTLVGPFRREAMAIGDQLARALSLLPDVLRSEPAKATALAKLVEQLDEQLASAEEVPETVLEPAREVVETLRPVAETWRAVTAGLGAEPLDVAALEEEVGTLVARFNQRAREWLVTLATRAEEA